MMVLVTYDVSLEDPEGPRRLRHLAKICLDYGVRVQYSVFECEVEPAQWVRFKEQLLKAYEPGVDSLRFYRLGKEWRGKVEHHGAKPALDIFKSDLII
ncbi:CRISPR-associated endonuclease Cas2 [Serratia symbiotica]|uniref:CRISPR-associated endoribonuclease Cas2 n=1 Tax=Serratia symbiotica TaxID=138074 RepID=A0A068Z0L7_9GAMM|nr:CRISPR-associated endonuclease Cas2 [Serratia symbiotica]MBF1996287.1 CRISPR-associated endonuclease Cas2 [Serratia symbiotica]QLH62210.1 CRISPR-associated endonuclease Cas2 [Serratia symbiotica]QTP15116.1 CRISPR-associated endonuclease Cas2 [Serratia symbiotica]CDS55786.1 CRISPR-associated endoribonuclease Cas2 [Serratia symbiotica]